MTLREKQNLFVMLLAKLFVKANEMGYELSLGDAYRDPRLHGAVGEKKGYGHQKSCHKVRLAMDINLFKDGKFLGTTEDHKQLGEWWEQQHVLCRWGGRFEDGNHYSLEHEGMR